MTNTLVLGNNLSLVNPEETEQTVEPLDLNAEGVSSIEIQRWKKAANRFPGYNSPSAVYISARPEDYSGITRQFLDGENIYIPKSTENLVNNPLRLLRPTELQSFEKFSKQHCGYRYNRAQDYCKLVAQFEGLSIAALEYVQKGGSKEKFKKALDLAFNTERKNSWDPQPVQEIILGQSPFEWLAYITVSILNHPSEEITPVGRLRILELLSLFESEEISERTKDKSHNSIFFKGYNLCHKPSLPYTFANRSERTEEEIGRLIATWSENQFIKALLKTSDRGIFDRQATFNGIVNKYPEEAVQITLLMLHEAKYVEDAIFFLQSLPKLDRKTLGRMFGRRATFLIQHKLEGGKEEEILRALGINEDPRQSRDIEETREELIQALRRQEAALSYAEEQLAEMQIKLNDLYWENLRNREGLRFARAEAEYWKNGGRGRAPDTSQFQVERLIDQLDPKGYYRILNLHPIAFTTLEEGEIEDLVKRMYRFQVGKLHPDRRGESSTHEEMKLLNNAKDCFLNPTERKAYGKTP